MAGECSAPKQKVEGVPTGTGLSEWIAGSGHSSGLPTQDNTSLSLTSLGSDMREDIRNRPKPAERMEAELSTRLVTFVEPSV